MYADDVVILSSSKTGLQEKLGKLEKFCSDWCLQINVNHENKSNSFHLSW